MLALRIAAYSGGRLLGKETVSTRVPLQTVLRTYRNESKFAQRARARMNLKSEETVLKKPKIGPMEIGQLAVGGGAAIGLGSLCYYGLGLSNELGAIDRVAIWPQYVRDRIRDTYFYFGATTAATAAAAVGIFRSPLGVRFFNFCARSPILSTVAIIGGMIGTGQAMMMIPYTPGLGTKHLFWAANCAMIGLAVAPIGLLGYAIAARAAWYTAGVVGGLSLVAATAPSDKFLTWSGPLGIGLGVVIVGTLGSVFVPATSTLGLSLYSISLYGGLLLFSGLLLYDTQRIVKRAETHPVGYGVQRCYDPINASHAIFMDALNIFVRIASILGMTGGRRK